MPSVVEFDRSSVGGEYRFTERDFQRIATILHEDSGIALAQGRQAMVYSRLSKRLRALGLRDFESYCSLVESAQGSAERRSMLSALTTNLTRFYREPHHFEHLRQTVLPACVATARKGGRVRLWSAACSTGAEAYSMALEVLAALPDAASHDVRILASDIDPNVIEQAANGFCEEKELETVPSALRSRWFERQKDGTWQARPELRELIAFKELNLTQAWPMKGKFQAIFCRNVAIYFDEATQSRLWARLTERLDPGGYLYIGHSERISGPATPELANVGVTIYRKKRSEIPR